MPVKPLHSTFPLTAEIMKAISRTPDLDYSHPETAQRLLFDLRDHPQIKLEEQNLAGMSAGELAAVGLIGKLIFHLLLRYLENQNPDLLADLTRELGDTLRSDGAEQLFDRLVKHYPPRRFFEGQRSRDQFIKESTGKIPHRQLLTLSLLALLLDQENRAFRKYGPLLDAPQFTREDLFSMSRQGVEAYFERQPAYRQGLSFWHFLQQPFRMNPDSIFGQLEFILQHWKDLLDENWLISLRRRMDLIREDHRRMSLGPAPAQTPDFSSRDLWPDEEGRRFSMDLDWMPRVVLLAKNIYVWLDQLSTSYGRPINHLDQIPGEELNKLASWGINGLWLIGIWQRSPASKKIKRMTGNPEAEASAYALYEYRIADQLGGEEAFHALREQARQSGIRLAADMVPNHVGIDSRWVLDHPDRFISLPESPFPAYSFNGPDLADDARIQIFLEDHYYDQSDAAVVFKRFDPETGDVRYIYHGNDGTSMPWNDTAQLNFLNEQVRQAVLETILDVAKQFSIIRFDAAMTLAKKHFQRLWFPEPGSGGAIPSRARSGLSKAEFNRLFPKEFWREVVDRVAEEAPDTLLLAEAFWMMEGYFVRSLGMHRVYNSAFMHMLKNEENAKYRGLIKETLEFDPQILKRYVNFLNNPDEDTALDQFGKGGKYFGVCMLMATMPGLPMFGHGQIEGYSEKYGMEYRRSYVDEQPDQELIARHEREIFPLLKKRGLFAGVEDFVLYDFQKLDGTVNEDVFAFSNRDEERSALVVFHNQWSDTRGSIHQPASPHPPDLTLGQALHLDFSSGEFIRYRDWLSGEEYLVSSRDFQQRGMILSLGAYDYHVFSDFKTVSDPEGFYGRLAEKLAGNGTPDLERELKYLQYEDAFNQLNRLLDPELAGSWAPKWELSLLECKEHVEKAWRKDFELIQEELEEFYRRTAKFSPAPDPVQKGRQVSAGEGTSRRLKQLRSLSKWDREFQAGLGREGLLAVYLDLIFDPLEKGDQNSPREILLEMLASRPPAFLENSDPGRLIELVRSLDRCEPPIQRDFKLRKTTFVRWFDSEPCRNYLYVHEHEGLTWFQKEALLTLVSAFLLEAAVSKDFPAEISADNKDELEKKIQQVFKAVARQAEKAGYQMEPFLQGLQEKVHSPGGD